MHVAVDWINDHLDQKLALNQVVEALELAGVEVEDVIEPTSLDDRIIAAKVLDIKPHPSADKLQLAVVDTAGEELEIVCGAPNIEVGQVVPLARVGAHLADGSVIKKTEIRGRPSNGMLLSPKELGVGEDHSGILVLPANVKPGRPLHELYSHNQTVLDIKTAANRPDLLSIIGLAREVAVHSQAKLKSKPAEQFERVDISAKGGDRLFSIQAKEAVSRYSVAKISLSGPVGSTPDWLAQRLLLSGLRPINLVVDLTNYVMLETGQPLHAFDENKLHGKLNVRFAKKSESLSTLDGVERSLTSKDLVIADSRGPQALAGVMGGETTEITDNTKTLLVETATFDGAVVRKTAARHNVRTESSSRFEKGLPPQFVMLGLERFGELLNETTKADVELVEDEMITKATPTKVTVEPARFSVLAGIEVTNQTATSALERLDFGVAGSKETSDKLSITVPYWRPDVSLEEDVFEEVVKVIGLDQLPPTLPVWQPHDVVADDFWGSYWRLRNVLAGLGLHEVTTYPFVSEGQLETIGYEPTDHLKLQNPRSEEQAYLRRSLLPSLLEAVANNTRRRDSFGLFEVAKTYIPSNRQLPDEPMKIGVIIQSPKDTYARVKNVFDQLTRVLGWEYDFKPTVKYNYAHPGRQADIYADDKPAGQLAEVHPSVLSGFKIKHPVAYLELDLARVLAAWQQPLAKPLPRFQPATRDITILLPRHTPWLEVKEAIEESALAAPRYKGDYFGKDVGDDQRALTIGLKVYGQKGTLTDQEANEQVDEVLKLLGNAFGATLKGS